MPTDARAPNDWGVRSLCAVLCVAALLQAVIWWRSPLIDKDGVIFIRMAQGLLSDPVATMREADQHPGYPALILVGRAAYGWVTGTVGPEAWAGGARAVSFVMGLAGIVFLWWIARRAFDGRTACLAALFLTFLPLFRRSAANALSDTTCLTLHLLGAWLLIEAIRRRKAAWLVGAAAAGAAAYLVRPEGIAVTAVALCAPLLLVFRRETRPFALRGLLAGAVIATAAGVPYVLVKGTPTGKKDVPGFLAGLMESPAGSAELAARLEAGSLELGHLYASAGLRYVLLVPLLAAIALPGRRRAHAVAGRICAALAALHLAFLVLLLLIAGYAAGRHVMVLSAYSMPWVAAGTVRLGGMLHARAPVGVLRRLGPDGCALLLGVAVSLGLLPRTIHALHPTKIPILEAADWVRTHTAPSDRILTTSAYILFYGDRPGTQIRNMGAPLPELGGGERPPFELVILEDDQMRPERPWVAQITAQFEEYDEPGLSGGSRGIKVFKPR